MGYNFLIKYIVLLFDNSLTINGVSAFDIKKRFLASHMINLMYNLDLKSYFINELVL